MITDLRKAIEVEKQARRDWKVRRVAIDAELKELRAGPLKGVPLTGNRRQRIIGDETESALELGEEASIKPADGNPPPDDPLEEQDMELENWAPDPDTEEPLMSEPNVGHTEPDSVMQDVSGPFNWSTLEPSGLGTYEPTDHPTPISEHRLPSMPSPDQSGISSAGASEPFILDQNLEPPSEAALRQASTSSSREHSASAAVASTSAGPATQPAEIDPDARGRVRKRPLEVDPNAILEGKRKRTKSRRKLGKEILQDSD
ncbi:hypothetical protein HMN09_00036200 [Mycena chlorophos]|uniref:Uncharacterized protein n=1 Tax=Mycena chlorophos TaxID=658473 RepID=A0A8H6WM89_MYCCL|nr:hypothetical protein HMN09_00036200 [Mycena chlorophos]